MILLEHFHIDWALIIDTIDITTESKIMNLQNSIPSGWPIPTESL